jgi:hypothetical protein
MRSFGLVFVKSDDTKRILVGAFWAACAGYLLQLMAGLSVTGNTFLLWTALAVVLAPGASVVTVKAPNWGNVAAAVAVVLIVAGIGYQFVILSADRAYLVARIGATGVARTASARRAVALNPFNDMYRAEVGLALTDETFDALSAVQGAQDRDQAMSAAQMKFQEAEAALRAAIDFVPSEFDNYVFLTNLYNVGGQTMNSSYYAKAVEIADIGVAVEPFGPALRVQRARALIVLGRKDEALKDLEIAVKLDPIYEEAALFLSKTYVSAGRTDDAIRMLRKVPGWSERPDIKREVESLESSGSATSTVTP